MNTLENITERIRAFRDARDWMQFHNPKNLACSIAIEAGELLEHFQWKSEAESQQHCVDHRDEVAAEMADITIYLLGLADNLGIDLLDAIDRKLVENDRKYPVAKARGKAAKYTEL